MSSDGLPGFYMVGSLAPRWGGRGAGSHSYAECRISFVCEENYGKSSAGQWVRKEGTACRPSCGDSGSGSIRYCDAFWFKADRLSRRTSNGRKIKPVRGVLSMVPAMAEKGWSVVFFQRKNVEEGVAADCMEIVKIRNLQEVVESFK